MTQFSLDKWLEDKSRKVVTREGKNVEIIHTNSPVPHHPIVGFIDKSIYTWTIDGKLIYGKEEQDKNDLFFADEEDGLTEFEKAIRNILVRYISNIDDFPETIIREAKSLLDLARKELGLVDDTCGEYALNEAYKQGKQDALKDLPKWKKATEDKKFDKRVCVMDYYMFPFLDTEVNKGDYYIELSDLKALPKEE